MHNTHLELNRKMAKHFHHNWFWTWRIVYDWRARFRLVGTRLCKIMGAQYCKSRCNSLARNLIVRVRVRVHALIEWAKKKGGKRQSTYLYQNCRSTCRRTWNAIWSLVFVFKCSSTTDTCFLLRAFVFFSFCFAFHITFFSCFLFAFIAFRMVQNIRLRAYIHALARQSMLT